MSDLTCAEFAGLAAELALGLLSGDERAAALAHLARCSACRSNLDELARTADALLLVAPRAEPPAGFESRVLNRLAAEQTTTSAGSPGPIRRLRRNRASVTARPKQPRRWIGPFLLAAALALIAGTVGVVAGGLATSHPRPSAIRTATVWADAGKSTCHVVAIPGQDGRGAEVLLRLDEMPEAPSAYPVLVEPADGGAPIAIGTVDVANGAGTFDRVMPTSIGKIRGVRVLEEDGSVRYRATFAPI